MHHAKLSLSLFGSALLLGCAASTPVGETKVSQHLDLFQPPAFNPVSATRGVDGRPTSQYWQQQADYAIEATLIPEKRRVEATATLTYTNNAPVALPYLWFELPLDAQRDTSRSSAIRHINTRFRASGPEFGHRGLSFTLGGEELDAVITDTRAQVRLPYPVSANGGTIELGIEWSFIVPEGSNRMGVLEYEDDDLFQIARWIPQPCVYDDIYGWNTLPYLGAGESYSNFGDYSVTVRAPEGVTVVGGGVWLNPEDGLTAEQLDLYVSSLQSDTPIWIIGPDDVEAAQSEEARTEEVDASESDAPSDEAAEPEPEPELVEWRYVANNVRTFAFVAGASYLIDGAGVDIGETRVRTLSVYPPGVQELWHPISTPATRHALDFYSDFLGLNYPYPVMVNAFGVEGGTEYPMISYCGSRPPRKPEAPDEPDAEVILDDGTVSTEGIEHEKRMVTYRQRFERQERGLFGVTDHEALHAWFPMVVGNDERRDGWMDEGFNEFGNPYSQIAWDRARKQAELGETDEEADQVADADAAGDGVSEPGGADSVDVDGPLNVVRNISRFAFRRPVPAILEWPDRSQAYGARGLNVYSKPGAGLITLREGILGPERFDYALSQYLNAWAFKHPRPGDFFRAMENAAGEDLGWFWRGWFGTTSELDFAVRRVERTEPTRGKPYWAVKVEMVGDMPAPMDVRFEFEDGAQMLRHIPVEAWYGGREFTLRLYDEDRTPFSVLLDPDRVLPESNRNDNRWTHPTRR